MINQPNIELSPAASDQPSAPGRLFERLTQDRHPKGRLQRLVKLRSIVKMLRQAVRYSSTDSDRIDVPFTVRLIYILIESLKTIKMIGKEFLSCLH